MLSDRNTKYTEALIREGKNFDYNRWLDQVRDEEAQAKRLAAASNSREPTMPQPSDPAKAAAIPNPSPRSRAAAEIQKLPTFRNPISRAASRDPKRSKKSIAWRLGRVCDEWDRFQESRNRDAVYGYLRAVFSIGKRYGGRRRTRKLMRRAFKYAGLPVDMTADPFAVVIRSTCEQKVD